MLRLGFWLQTKFQSSQELLVNTKDVFNVRKQDLKYKEKNIASF